jgi:recombination DNA repair RAD52 pathway protein
MTLIGHASENWDIIFSQHFMNRTIRRTPTHSKSSSLPLDEASLLLADEPNANSQTDRSYYLNEA